MSILKEKVGRFILEKGLLPEDARVVVGLSGGPDSVCLAMMLHELGYEVVGAHCNFHLRGEESMRDERFVKALCQEWGWRLFTADFNTAEYAQEHGISIEMAAREQRYDWFRRVKEETGAEAIAVGHHQDDNTETLLLNLVRGTGMKGLCGMQPRNNDVVRPLLCLNRQEILDFLQSKGQSYVTDHTNLEDAYARNKVRLNVLPLLESINKGARGNIASTMENLNEVQKVYQHAIRTAMQSCWRMNEMGEQCVNIEALQQQPSPISILHEWLSPLGFNKAQLKEVLGALAESGKMFAANGHRLLIDRQDIILEAEHYPMPDIQQEMIPIEELTIQKSPLYAYLDADKLHTCPCAEQSSTIELTLRTPKPGDTFAPFGMGGKRKLLSDFLTDQKLNLFEKERQPLLMDGEEIAWVVGRRSSELYRVDETTKRVVILCLRSSQR